MDVYIRELALTDLPRLNAWRSEPDLVTAMGAAFQFVGPVDDRWYAHYQASRHDTVRLAIELRRDPPLLPDANGLEHVGVVNLMGIHPINRSAELAVMIGEPSARGQGVGHVATWLMLNHAFMNLNLNRVWGQIVANNTLSLKLCQRLGFVTEGTQRQAVYLQGHYQDLITVSMLSQDFNPMPARHNVSCG
jgi:RimJ/RimL family protein N-acetyltransferase